MTVRGGSGVWHREKNRNVIKVYRRIGDTDVKSHDTHVKIHKNRLLRDVLTKNECIPVAACTQMCIP